MTIIFYIAKKIIILVVVLLVTLLLTIFLLGSTIDKIMLDNIRIQVINSFASSISENQRLNQFDNMSQRQEFLDQQMDIQIKSLGLDEPWYSPKKIMNTLFQILILNLGNSRFFTTYDGSSSVNDLIQERLPNTILLFTTSSLTIVLLGIVIGSYLARKEGKLTDKFIAGLASVSLSIPPWWFSMIMIVLFSFFLQIFPARSTPVIPPDSPGYVVSLLYHMALPFITIVLIGFASSIYYVKYIVLRIIQEDYIKTLGVIGIPSRKILLKHALKNASPQLTTMLGIGIISTLGGSILIEEIFDWPGMGNLFYNAIIQNDSPLIIGLVYFFTLLYLTTRLVLDLALSVLDPRIRTGDY
ncbi:Dipeptide transport system permease protein DppB [Candidatus Nitrosocosmicus franklandus]|uniref:Dipeptide transport system permease protein DppB n=2 Tax=Candidatus Nitrosocosmicus franklandianus TaxID=1798806 RepID=A0A484II41_9ARCH|nr:Dipeptide transport system permease protein DppB [Candidatus Nitrosocosmicus franklandus]